MLTLPKVYSPLLPPPISFHSISRKSSTFRCNSSQHNQQKRRQISTTIDMKKISHSIHQLLPHLIQEPGFCSMLYDDNVMFNDPTSSFSSLSEYVLYLKILSRVSEFYTEVHYVKQTGRYEITTRWTCVMKVWVLPGNPKLVLTGFSILGINPDTKKICSHEDHWDSMQKNKHFFPRGLWACIRQLDFCKNLDVESSKYQILKRTENYEIRKYSSFVVAEAVETELSVSTAVNGVSGSGGIIAVSKFRGKPTEDVVCDRATALRAELVKDGLKPKQGFMFVCQNDPRHAWSFLMGNEVLIWIQDFTLE